jgi:hypothetical protein
MRYYFYGKKFALILTENGLGHILGDFSTNSSGHPDPNFKPKTHFLKSAFQDDPLFA